MSIIINHVSHIYNADTNMPVKALKDINLQINDGEFIGLIGHTGSGKSTLIQHMNALLKPTEGEIYYNRADINDKEFNRRDLRSKVGLVFQYPEHQLFETDVFKDVCYGPKNLGLSTSEVELRAYTALKQVGLEDSYFYQSPFDLSGGQKKRVAIAGILAMHPDVLILDEPTAGLDPKGRDEILDLISKLHDDNGITIILVSHSMEDVSKYVQRLIVMNDGSVLYDDKPITVFKHYQELEEIGLAAPQVVYIMNELRKSGLQVNPEVSTIEEARDEILKALGKK